MTTLFPPASRTALRFALLVLTVVAGGCSGSSSTPPSTVPPTDPLASTCPAPTGAGTDHSGDVTSNITWTAASSPHRVPFSFSITAPATLTLEPCATVKVADGMVITVIGRLVAAGQAGRPVTIDSGAPGERWGYITARATPASPGPITTFIDLAYTRLVNGGLTAINGLGLIDLRGNAFNPRQGILRVNNVLIDGTSGSYGYGVVLREGLGFTDDSTALTIKNAVTYPIRADDKLVGTIPPGTYTGNGIDEIVWTSVVDIDEATTIHDRGIPYRLGEQNGNGKDMKVGTSGTGAALTTLSIEAGVTIKVHPAGRLIMQKTSLSGGGYQSSGSLRAIGTAARPITFTSAAATPFAGDWVALWFAEAPAANALLDHVRVEYAGGPTQANSAHCSPTTGGFSASEDSAILMFGQPPSPFVTNTVIANSAGDGFGRAYTGTPIDFMAAGLGNSFVSVAGCKQGWPRADTTMGGPVCPPTVPCP